MVAAHFPSACSKFDVSVPSASDGGELVAGGSLTSSDERWMTGSKGFDGVAVTSIALDA